MRTLVRDYGMEMLDKPAAYMKDPRRDDPNYKGNQRKFIPRVMLGDLRKEFRVFTCDLNVMEHMKSLAKRNKIRYNIKASESLDQMQ